MRLQPRIGVCVLSAVSIPLSLAVLLLPTSATAVPLGAALKDYQVEYLLSDGSIPSEHEDLEFRNGWGIAASATGPWWVAVNENEVAKVFNADGSPQDLRVVIPGAPTGIVHSDSAAFVVTDGTASGPARFMFATESGKIFGWNPSVGPAPPQGQAYLGVDQSATGAVYKGLAIAQTGSGDRIYAADFHNGRVDVFDGMFAPVMAPGAFVDPRIPAGFAPFGIQNLAGRIFVSYAKQDADAMDEIAGQGLGFVSVFDTDGHYLAQVGAHGQLNAPWGMTISPVGFGSHSRELLVSNFGDGAIVAFKMTDDMLRFNPSGVLRDASRKPLKIDGLWGIGFGNGAQAGDPNALYFAAGPAGESHGAFGRVTLAP